MDFPETPTTSVWSKEEPGAIRSQGIVGHRIEIQEREERLE